MKAVYAAWLALAPMALPAFADEVVLTNKIAYENVTVTDFEDGYVTFKLSEDRTVTKSLKEVVRIALSGNPEFDKAEKLAIEGKLEAAEAAYDAALKAAKEPWRRMLVHHRKASAHQAKGKAEAGPSAAPSAPDRCYYCRGGGMMNCQECRGSGLGKCSHCFGNGKMDCASCAGSGSSGQCPPCNSTGRVWTTQSYSCGSCGGTGYRQSTYWSGGRLVRSRSPCGNCGATGRQSRMVEVACGVCGGTGRRPCARCGTNPQKGKVPCPVCGVSGRSGPCAVCGGKKKTPCTYCAAGNPPGAVPAQPQPFPPPAPPSAFPPAPPSAFPPAPPPAPPSLQPPAPPAEPLASPDSLAQAYQAGAPKHPQDDAKAWEQMTALQREQAEQDYTRKLAEWQHAFRGKKVAWKLALEDVSKDPDGDGYVVTALSDRRHIVTMVLPVGARDALLKINKGNTIEVAGTIQEHRFTRLSLGGAVKAPGLAGIVLAEAAVSPAK